MSDDSDSDFGFGSSSPFLDDDEPSTTTTEAVIDDGSTREQQQQQEQEDTDTVIVIEKNKDNEKLKENKDIPSLDGEQDNEDSSISPEAVIDDGSAQEQQQEEDTDTVIVIEKNKDNKKSFLSPYTDRLLSFIFKMRETRKAVSVNSIELKASQLSREFREKSMAARHSAICRFINVHGFMYQMGTHLSQRQPSEMEEIATDFVCVTREKLQMSCSDEAYIINMDQTPVPFLYDPSKTIEVVGRRTIHIRKSTCETKCTTYALTVTASGKMITPLFVFKGNN